jgi:hypothetical protein
MIAALRTPVARRWLIAIGSTAVAIAIISLAYGQIRLSVGGYEFFKSSGVWRPSLVAILCGLLAGESRRATRIVVPLLMAGLLPLPAYRQMLGRLDGGESPMRSTRDCVLEVAAGLPASAPRGLYVSGFESDAFGHEHYYYFRRVRPWEREDPPSFARLQQYLYDPAQPRPMFIQDSLYQAFVHRVDSESPRPAHADGSQPMAAFGSALLLLPGPYAVCSSQAAALSARR